MNLNSGSTRQSHALELSISTTDATPSATSIHHSPCSSRRFLATIAAAMAVTMIRPSATHDTFQLNATKSGSFEWVKRKFSAGRRLSEMTCVICTQRSSHAAGKM